MTTPHYQRPNFFTQHVFNPVVAFATGVLGISLKGSRVLSVRGRTTGEWHSTPVNPLPFEGRRYLVAPRGTTQWVRNIRVSHEGRLRHGRRRETIRVEEVTDAEKPPILRAYLRAWAWEVGQFFGGVGPDAPESELLRIAPSHPVFRIVE